VSEAAYEVRLTNEGELEWIERRGGEVQRHSSAPGLGPIKRAWIGLLAWLPIEWML
jgi:putative cardiolipin synthase